MPCPGSWIRQHPYVVVQMALDAALLQHVRAPGVREEHPETLAERILAAAEVLRNETMFQMHDAPTYSILEQLD